MWCAIDDFSTGFFSNDVHKVQIANNPTLSSVSNVVSSRDCI